MHELKLDETGKMNFNESHKAPKNLKWNKSLNTCIYSYPWLKEYKDNHQSFRRKWRKFKQNPQKVR